MGHVSERKLLSAQFAVFGVLVICILLCLPISTWHPFWLLVTLAFFAIASDRLTLSVRALRVSGGFSAGVLTLVFFGPAPGALVALATLIWDYPSTRGVAATRRMVNPIAYLTLALIGGLLARELGPKISDQATYASFIVVVFMVANLANFVVVYGYNVLVDERKWLPGFRDMFIPVLPASLALAMLTAGVTHVIRTTSDGAVVFLAVALLLFQYLLKMALESSEQKEELLVRNRQLASLQVGLVSTVLRTLNLRDNMTARHSAAVARYSREIAEELGLDERQQNLIHTAGLFHDVGKFIFPDSILVAESGLTDEEFEIVKRHPVVGADLIAGLEGYEDVAEMVRYHHEQVNGSGYPEGLIGDAIPVGARILAVADVYDVITARDTYRTPVSILDACRELRRVAGRQLDAHIVEAFVRLVETRGLSFGHHSDADFEAELALESRVRGYAEPLKEAV